MKESSFLSASSTDFVLLFFLLSNIAVRVTGIRSKQLKHGDRSLWNEWFRLPRAYRLQGSRPENGILHCAKNVRPHGSRNLRISEPPFIEHRSTGSC